MTTVAVIAEGYLWEHSDTQYVPGNLLPEAKDRLAALLATNRVVVCSYAASTLDGAKRCQRLIESMGFGLGPKLDLHVSLGFPLFDRLVSAPDPEPAK